MHDEKRTAEKSALFSAIQSGRLKDFLNELETFKDDEEVIKAAAQKKGEWFAHASARLRNDKAFFLNLIAARGKTLAAFPFASEALRDDEDVVAAVIGYKGAWFEFASARLRNDKAFLLAAFKSRVKAAEALEFAAEAFKDDAQVVTAAVKKDGHAFAFASDRLRRNKAFVLHLLALHAMATNNIPKSTFAFQHANASLQDDPEVALAALKQNDAMWRFVSTRLREDRPFIFAAIECNPMVFKHFTEALKDDTEVAQAAIQKDGFLLEAANPRFRHDKAFLLRAAHAGPMAGAMLLFVSDDLKDDAELVKASVQKESNFFRYASDRLRHDREFVLDLLKHCQHAWQVLLIADERFRDDEEMILAIAAESGHSAIYASERLMSDRAFVLQVLSVSENTMFILQYALDQFRDDEEMVTTAIRRHGEAMYQASERLRHDKAFVLAMLQLNPNAYVGIGSPLREDPEVVLSAIPKNEHMFHFTPLAVWENRALTCKILSACSPSQRALLFSWFSEDVKADPNVRKAAGVE